MNKGRIINFEWLCDHNHYTPDEFDPILIKLVKNDIDVAVNDGCNIIFGLYLMDGFLFMQTRHQKVVNVLKELNSYAISKGIKKVYIVSGQGEFIDPIPLDHFFIDFNTRMVTNSYKDIELPKFNPNTNKFLFLTGMPNRDNRIGLMSKLYEANLLDRCEWTFFPPWTKLDKEWCRNHLSSYDDETYNKFLTECARSFDNKFETASLFYGTYNGDTDVVWHDILETEWINSPTHIDSSVYESTSFSIISEGPNYWLDDHRFVTEKTWRTFMHRHPFILAGWPDMMDYLKYLGFKTFEEYMLIKDYAYIKDSSERMSAVVKNTEHFLKNMHKNINKITKDVEHNYNLFFEEVNKQENILNLFENSYGVPKHEIDYYFNCAGYDRIIRKLPSNI